ncbi:ubiquinone biosynthesis accessory factor UbiJ [Oceanobacter antarcticus]|jgi:ubiquinone biosynthesis protein UbiJ|uniref:Ubiquinone biosynthesis accessory factor UbiJ n=1 Tax=Oceanobacter antarcticus TaxID=3133425 RepID=A0ABW8NH64_9GAMM
MFFLPAELTHALCLPWEAALNHALKYDPATLQQLERHNGRLIQIRCTGTGTLSVRILDRGVQLGMTRLDPTKDDMATADVTLADVTLTGTLPDFVALARASNKASALMSGSLALEGDTELAMAVSGLLDQLDIDWEAMLSPVTGGLIAHQLGEGIRGLMNWGKTTGKTFATAAHDYAVDEAGLVVSQAEMDHSADQIDQLTLAADRVAARIQQLEAAAAANGTNGSAQPHAGEV